MNKDLIALAEYWEIDRKGILVSVEDLSGFENTTGLKLPDDLKEYFLYINGMPEKYDDFFTDFFTFDKFKTVQQEVGDFGGIPDYRDIVNTLPNHLNCYVFADHSIHLAIFAIRLYPIKTRLNEIYTICGSNYDLVANSFKEYLHGYINNNKRYL